MTNSQILDLFESEAKESKDFRIRLLLLHKQGFGIKASYEKMKKEGYFNKGR